MGVLNFMTAVLVLIALGYGGYWLYHYYLRKRYATLVEPEDFIDNIRRVQVVDVREPQEFDRKHILGARNLPTSQFKQLATSLRRDRPIYLYCDTLERASRCAKTLHQEGYTDVYILKGGIDKWYGKVKSND